MKHYRRILLSAILASTVVIGAAGRAEADDKKPITVTVLVRGAHCDACTKAVSKELSKVKGIRFDEATVFSGTKPRYFSDPLELQIGHTLDTGIGAAAKAVSKSETPHRDDIPPRLHLVLFTDRDIDEASPT